MQRRKTHRIGGTFTLAAALFITALISGHVAVASAQVVIDMPPPKPRPRAVTPPPPAPPGAATPATVLDAPLPPRLDPEPGAIAFQQYTRTRYLPADRFGRIRRPFSPEDFTRTFIEHGLFGPFRVVTPMRITIVQPGPIIVKPPGFGK